MYVYNFIFSRLKCMHVSVNMRACTFSGRIMGVMEVITQMVSKNVDKN
jgi:hypothetical protein